ncbi:MAG: hypothetical protein ACRDRN_01560 [Sciscionella sp.]
MAQPKIDAAPSEPHPSRHGRAVVTGRAPGVNAGQPTTRGNPEIDVWSGGALTVEHPVVAAGCGVAGGVCDVFVVVDGVAFGVWRDPGAGDMSLGKVRRRRPAPPPLGGPRPWPPSLDIGPRRLPWRR